MKVVEIGLKIKQGSLPSPLHGQAQPGLQPSSIRAHLRAHSQWQSCNGRLHLRFNLKCEQHL